MKVERINMQVPLGATSVCILPPHHPSMVPAPACVISVCPVLALPPDLKLPILLRGWGSQKSAFTRGGKLSFESSFMFLYRFLISGNGELLYAAFE